MNVPAATWFHRCRARARLRMGPLAERVIVWTVGAPGDDMSVWEDAAPAEPVLREDALARAEALAATRPAIVFFVGPSPTRWLDLLDVVEVFRIGGAAVVLATPPGVLNPMSAPVYAYHFTRIYVVTPAEPDAGARKAIAGLTALYPRGPVERRVWSDAAIAAGEVEGVERTRVWPSRERREAIVVAANLTTARRETPWPWDHVWFERK